MQLTMIERKAGLYLVDDLDHAVKLAKDLGTEAIGFDVEGVLEPFYGNDPDKMPVFEGLHTNTRLVAGARNNRVLDMPIGLITNSTNHTLPGQNTGLVDLVADHIGGSGDPIPYVHRGMTLPDGTKMGKKPTGVQGVELARRLDANPAKTVLIDDQGVKNFGEVATAGMQAIIVPSPIGFLDARGRVIEHPGVMKFRSFEHMVYNSLASRGPGFFARAAYKTLAGVPISKIGDFEDLRTS